MVHTITKFQGLIFGTMALLFTVGCNLRAMEIDHGELPSMAVPYVKPYVGRYTARFNSTSTPFRGFVYLNLQGNHISMQPAFDIVGNGCGSKVGELRRVGADTDSSGNYTSGHAAFDFSSGSCGEVPQRTAYVLIRDSKIYLQFTLKISHGNGRPPVDTTISYLLTKVRESAPTR